MKKQRKARQAERATQGGAVVVYRSGQLYEADIVADALKRANFPFFRREESLGGITLAMPVAPSMGPGALWAVLVPESWADRAEHFIAKLPVSHDLNPGPWAFRPRPEVRKFFKQWSWVYVIVILVAFIWSIVTMIRGH